MRRWPCVCVTTPTRGQSPRISLVAPTPALGLLAVTMKHLVLLIPVVSRTLGCTGLLQNIGILLKSCDSLTALIEALSVMNPTPRVCKTCVMTRFTWFTLVTIICGVLALTLWNPLGIIMGRIPGEHSCVYSSSNSGAIVTDRATASISRLHKCGLNSFRLCLTPNIINVNLFLVVRMTLR